MLTVADVLEIEPLLRAVPHVLAGSAGLGAPVRWVHVSDLDSVASLLDGGELLLTTGGFLRLSDDEAVAELERLVERGAVGVVAELADPPEPAEAVVGRAEELALPLVVLRGRTRFVEVTELVHRRLVSTQLEEVSFAAEVHASFTALGLQRADRATIVDAAARLLGGPVVLEDQRRRVLGSATIGGSPTALLEEWERRSRAATWRAGTAQVGPEGWVTTTVGVQGRVWARLVSPEATGSRAAVVLERAAQALELGRMIERDDMATELRLHGSLLSDLVTGRLAAEAEATARLRAIGLPPATAYVGLVAACARGAGVEAAQQLRRTLAGLHLSALVAPLDDDHVGVLLAGPGEALERLVPPDSVVVAAADPVDRVTDLPGAWRAARMVADVARDLPRRPHVVRHADVRLHGLLVSLGDSAALSAFVEGELGRVLAHDARHGTDLLGLLRAYLDAGGHVTALARATHRNRSSLYPALQRLEEVLGHELTSPSSRTSLAVALLAHDLAPA